MAKSTVDMQKMKNAASELEKIYTSMTTTKKKLDEVINSLPKMWKGEGATAYQQAYNQNSPNFVQLAEAIKGASTTLNTITTTYGKADAAAAEAIKSKMAKG